MIQEKRKTRRINFERPILMHMNQGKNTAFRSLNFSMDGIALLSPEKIEKGKRLFLTVNIAQPGKVRLLNVLGEVVYVGQLGNGYTVGLHFFDSEVPSNIH